MFCFKGNENKDVFGKSTVGFPIFYTQIHHTSVSFLLKESNGNSTTLLDISPLFFLGYFRNLFRENDVHLPESCCYFSPFLDSSRCVALQFESCNITPFRFLIKVAVHNLQTQEPKCQISQGQTPPQKNVALFLLRRYSNCLPRASSVLNIGSSNTFNHTCTIINVQLINVICSQYCSKCSTSHCKHSSST